MSNKEMKDRVTKEIALAITPIAAAYLFVSFYEAGFCLFYGIPVELIKINITDIFLTNRLTLMVAVLAFLWIGLYYNVLPSVNSPVFKGIITGILILSLWLGFTFGNADAKNKTDYLVIKSMPEEVVLKIYGDNVVTAPMDRQSRTFKQQFKIHKAGSNPGLSYHLEKIGQLSNSK